MFLSIQYCKSIFQSGNTRIINARIIDDIESLDFIYPKSPLRS